MEISHWKDFHEIWYFSIFRKFVDKIKFPSKYEKENKNFTWRYIFIYDSWLKSFVVVSGATVPSGLGLPHSRSFYTRRTTVVRSPLDEWSAPRRDLYLTTHNTHNRQTSMPPVVFETIISAAKRPQTCPCSHWDQRILLRMRNVSVLIFG